MLIYAQTLISFAASSDAIKFAKIDEYVTKQMKQTHIPGLSIGIVKGDKLLYVKGYGDADTGRSVTEITPFEIGSVSKSFTALAIMQLVEKDLINLNSPVDQYLPWFKAFYQNKPAVITVRQLLNQNSGVPAFHDNDVKAGITTEQIVKENFKNLKLVNTPGTDFFYSNANYIILGEIIQVVSGQSYKEYIEKNIFLPLDMKHSYVSKEEAVKNGLAAGYRRWFGIPIKADLPYFTGNAPCGHIISCAEDMSHYLSVYTNEGKYKDISILSPEGIATLIAPAVKTIIPLDTDATEIKYAMGWGVNYKNDQIDIIEHTGETSNYHAHAIIKPGENIAIIEMDNVGGFITAGQIAPGILKIIRNEQPSENNKLGTFILIYNTFYLLIVILLVISIIRLKHFTKRITKSNFRFYFNLVFTTLINLILPVFLLISAPITFGASWKATTIFSPDIVLVLILSSVVLFILGILKTYMIITTINNKSKTIKHM
jgi:CubicO group peptidase (beta-lactamase class C family)